MFVGSPCSGILAPVKRADGIKFESWEYAEVVPGFISPARLTGIAGAAKSLLWVLSPKPFGLANGGHGA